MRILHVCPGLPPLRSGGLTAYVVSLLTRQGKDARFDFVGVLYPAHETLRGRRCFVREIRQSGLPCRRFALTGASPIPLLQGTLAPMRDLGSKEAAESYAAFLRRIRPDAVHIHSFMGFGPYLVDEAKKQKIAVIFTAHDYAPICPTVTLFKENGCNCDDPSDCAACCRFAPGKAQRLMRDHPLLIPVRRHPKLKSTAASLVSRFRPEKEAAAFPPQSEYDGRREAFMEAVNSCDLVTFASDTVLETYRAFGFTGKAAVFPYVPDERMFLTPKKSSAVPACPTVVFLGRDTPEKGLSLLSEALRALEGEFDFRLKVLGTGKIPELKGLPCDKVTVVPTFSRDELDALLEDCDLAVIPSLWRETFGFTALEAFSKGVPLVVSDTVGFADHVTDGEDGWIFKSGDKEALTALLARLFAEPERIEKAAAALSEKDFSVFSASRHDDALFACYRQCGGGSR